MNLLITSAGRQQFLVKAFKKVLGKKGNVYACDMDKTVPALKVSDEGLVSPKFSEENYITWLIEICKKYEIDIIVSLNVDDLLVLEANRLFIDRHTNSKLIGGPLNSIKLSHDKYKVVQLAEHLGFPTVKTWLVDDMRLNTLDNFPVIAKPRFGKGARGNVIIQNQRELARLIDHQSVPYVIQEMLTGDEYGFDIINNFESVYVGVLGRRKIIQENGESFRAVTIDPAFWEKNAIKLSKELGHQGTLNCDVIFREEKGYLIDINFRFSGDYIFSHLAGANTPLLYVKFFENSLPPKTIYHPKINIIGQRSSNSAFIVEE